MAFLPCLRDSIGPKEKTLAVNKENFPNSGVSWSAMHSVSTTENSIYGHTAGKGSCNVHTGSFNCAGYSKIIVSCRNSGWGSGGYGAALYINGSKITSVTAGTSPKITYNLNGATSLNNVSINSSNFDGGDDAWISLALYSITFVP